MATFFQDGQKWLLLSALALCTNPVTAQNLGSIPGAIHNSTRDTNEFYQLQERLNQAASEQEPAPDELIVEPQQTDPAIKGGSAQSIQVSEFIVDNSDILSREQIAAVTGKYKQRDLAMDDLLAVLAELNELYREKNAVTARAILPPQRVQDGVVKIQLIEARLDEVVFKNRHSTSEQYLRSRIESRPGKLVDVPQLERDLVRFNGVNDVKLRAVLQPGSMPETTSYLIEVQEPKNLVTSVFVDNTGRDSIGEDRIGVSFLNNSLTGHRDRLAIGGSYAEGTDTAYASYNVPINTNGSRLIASYDYSKIDVISGELQSFNIAGKSTIASLHLSHPLNLSRHATVFGVLGFNAKESETIFDRVDKFESSIRSFSFTTEYQGLYDGYLVYANPRLNVGVDNFGGDDSFTTLSGEIGALFGLAEKQELLARLRGQWSDTRALLSAEQFQLGGASSVRGYPEGYLIGDEGYFLSLEYRYSLADFSRLLGEHSRLKTMAFIDHGGIYAATPGESSDREDYLLSVGVGLQYQYADTLQLSVQLGFPLDGKSNLEDDYAVHFLINLTPF